MPKAIPENATFEQRLVKCGKARCGQCQRGASHGPYWFATWKVGGRMKHRYVGKTRPMAAPEPEVAPELAQGGGVHPGPGIAKVAANRPPTRAASPGLTPV